MDASAWWLIAAALVGTVLGEVISRSLRGRPTPRRRMVIVGLVLALGGVALALVAVAALPGSGHPARAAALVALALAWAGGTVLWGSRRLPST